MFTRVQRGKECSYIKDIILCIFSHPFFSFFMQHKLLEEKDSLSFKGGSSFDLETCMSGTSWSLVFSLFTLSPKVPIRHLASDTPALCGPPSCTIIFLALGFQAGLLASSISLPKVSEHVACNCPAKESSVTPHCPEGEVGALPWL